MGILKEEPGVYRSTSELGERWDNLLAAHDTDEAAWLKADTMANVACPNAFFVLADGPLDAPAYGYEDYWYAYALGAYAGLIARR